MQKKNGVITIAHSHNTNNPTISIKNIVYKLYSYPTRFIADYFFGCSKLALTDRYGKNIIRKKETVILNNGIDTKKYIFDYKKRIKVRNSLKININQVVVGHVGRMTKQKNPFFILDVFKQLYEMESNSILLYVGKGEMKSEIENKIAMLGLKNNVIILENRSDVNDLMQAMDVFIFPSIQEGLGIVAIEAQASGLPVLASDFVQEEVDITKNIKHMSLELSHKIWAKELLKMSKIPRENTFDKIIKAKFDIDDSAFFLQNFYIRKSKEDCHEL